MLTKFLIIIIFIFSNNLNSIAPINISRPYDEFLLFDRLPYSQGDNTIFFEKSIQIKAVQDRCNEDVTELIADKIDVLQIYQKNQNCLAALKNSDPLKKIGQLGQEINIDDDSNNRGHLIPSGKLDINNIILTHRYNYNGISLTAALPILSVRLKNVCWQDLTPNITTEDALTHELITDNFTYNIKHLTNLDTRSWTRKGLGDLYLGGTWNQVYPQNKPFLKFVGLKLQTGLSFPTGKKRDYDKLLAFEFGNNGSTGLVFAGNLDLKFANYIRLGASAQFLYLFGNTNCERIKTDLAQTDLLFFEKKQTYRKWGITQHFDLYAELYNFCNKLSFQAFYDYLKHDNDYLFIYSDRFFNPIANNAQNLQEWSTHSLILNLKYQQYQQQDFAQLCHWSPAFELFYKLGFNGQNALLMNSIGAQFCVRF